MREFGIKFQRGLQRGLRPFTNSRPGAESMIECFNVQPTETGLRSKDELYSFGIERAIFEYTCVRDQNGIMWCYAPENELEIMVCRGEPEAINSIEPVNMTGPTIPYWHVMPCVDNSAIKRYVYPEIRVGELVVEDTPPSIGTGIAINAIDLRAVNGVRISIRPTSDNELEVTPL